MVEHSWNIPRARTKKNCPAAIWSQEETSPIQNIYKHPNTYNFFKLKLQTSILKDRKQACVFGQKLNIIFFIHVEMLLI